ncbi:ABC-type sugar transport system ATPase subunit [Bradyrhizobium sp. SBR1B]|nr:ABC-type sugar transport system ATPase subunit [Bradyrhizobium sp. SBR1B]
MIADLCLEGVSKSYRTIQILQNISLTIEPEIDARGSDAALMLQIDGLLNCWPRLLSDGQRQRLAIRRAIVREPIVFLFDGPLPRHGLAVQMRVQLAKLDKQSGNSKRELKRLRASSNWS